MVCLVHGPAFHALTDHLPGIRVSLYNAITEEETDKLIEYMQSFIEEETKNKQQ